LDDGFDICAILDAKVTARRIQALELARAIWATCPFVKKEARQKLVDEWFPQAKGKGAKRTTKSLVRGKKVLGAKFLAAQLLNSKKAEK